MATKTTTKKSKVAPEFNRVREFISRYSVLKDPELDVVTIWAMGTWCFSPMCHTPVTFPYLYITGEAGSGKTVLGQDSLGVVTRMWKSSTGATGPTLFRLLGRYDEETGEIENFSPTLCQDEIDATFNGGKDEPLRLSYNVGYKRGATIPRSAGKGSIDFPVYGPKIMMGIDNGHLPETVTQRSIRIELDKHSQDELDELGIQPFFNFLFDGEEEGAELQQMLSDWAKAHSQALRDYRPNAPQGLTGRQWEIARTLVQLAHEAGVEDRIIEALTVVFSRRRAKTNAKERLYRSIFALFTEHDVDRLPTRMVVERLKADGVALPGNSGKGLRSVLDEDGIPSTWIRMKAGHPGIEVKDGEPKFTSRGYMRHEFDGMFARYILDDDEDE